MLREQYSGTLNGEPVNRSNLMPEILEKFKAERKPDEVLLRIFGGLGDKEVSSVESLIEELSPSANALKAQLELLSEISARDNCCISELLDREEFQAALFKPGANRKERLALLRALVESWRYPERTKIEAMLSSARKDVVEDLGLSLELPASLEGGALKVVLQARSAQDFEKFGKKVSALAEHPSAKKIFDILYGNY